MSSDYTGPLVTAAHLYDLACAAMLLALCWAIGVLVLRRAGFQPNSAIDRSLFGTAVGAGVLSTSVLILGWMSLLRPWALGVLVVVLVAIALGSWKILHEELIRTGREIVSRMGRLGLLVLLVVAGFLILQASMPPSDWDVLTYHLDVPAEFLARGEVFLPVDNHHTAFVGLQHMLYLPLLAAGAASGPALLSAGFALLLAITMLAAGRRLLDESTGRLASVLVWGSPAILLVGITARVDVTATWFLVLAHFAMVVCLQRRRVGGWWWMAAVMMGLAIATKYLAYGYLVGLAPVIAWAVVRGRGWSIGSIRGLAGFGAVVLLVATPWLVKNTLLFGAPLYPYLAELRLESWLAEYLGTLAVPASIDPDVFRIPALTREPFSIVALFTDPGSMTPEGEGDFYFANFVLLLLPLALLGSRRMIVALLVPPLLYTTAVVLIADSSINLRYLIPAFVMGTLVACYGVVEVGRRLFSESTLRSVWCGMVLVICLLPAGFAMYNQFVLTNPGQHWLGLHSEREYLEDNDNPDIYVHARIKRWINEQLPRDARIVMLFEKRGFGFQPEVLQDNLSQSWPILAAGEPWRDCLRSTGATHVLVNYGHLETLIRRGLGIETVNWTDFSRFHRACLERHERLGSVVLYRVVR